MYNILICDDQPDIVNALKIYLAQEDYRLFEVEPEDLEAFLRDGDFTGINVTMPYKKDVIPYCAELSAKAKRLGAVNTIVKKEGKLYGYNTDYFGMRDLILRSGIDRYNSYSCCRDIRTFPCCLRWCHNRLPSSNRW